MMELIVVRHFIQCKHVTSYSDRLRSHYCNYCFNGVDTRHVSKLGRTYLHESIAHVVSLKEKKSSLILENFHSAGKLQ